MTKLRFLVSGENIKQAKHKSCRRWSSRVLPLGRIHTLEKKHIFLLDLFKRPLELREGSEVSSKMAKAEGSASLPIVDMP
jgi:hypothetical protein